jgi:hypothetical protein
MTKFPLVTISADPCQGTARGGLVVGRRAREKGGLEEGRRKKGVADISTSVKCWFA